jgi:hypothetical protein
MCEDWREERSERFWRGVVRLGRVCNKRRWRYVMSSGRVKRGMLREKKNK